MSNLPGRPVAEAMRPWCVNFEKTILQKVTTPKNIQQKSIKNTEKIVTVLWLNLYSNLCREKQSKSTL